LGLIKNNILKLQEKTFKKFRIAIGATRLNKASI